MTEAKDSFPKLMIAQIESLELKKLAQLCAGRVPVLLHPSLYRALKLTFPMDIGDTVLDRQITSDIGTSSLGQCDPLRFPSSLLIKFDFKKCLLS